MGILADPQRPPEVHAVSEVRIEVSFDRLAEARGFYEDLLGLRPWPAERHPPGGWGLGDCHQGVLLMYRHDAETDPVRRRLTLIVASLDRIEQRLVAERRDYQRLHGVSYASQAILLPDPDGNVIELRLSIAL